jgi:hypothetical protein
MAVLQPLWMSEGAWEAIRDRVVGPAAIAAQTSGAANAGALRALLDAWNDVTRDGPRVGVWTSPETAVALAGLLDEHPELADLLGS